MHSINCMVETTGLLNLFGMQFCTGAAPFSARYTATSSLHSKENLNLFSHLGSDFLAFSSLVLEKEDSVG